MGSPSTVSDERSVSERFISAAEIDPVIASIRSAQNIVVITGAGMSAPSGLPTFRGEGGLYTTSTEEPPVHLRDLTVRPTDFIEWHAALHRRSQGVEPNQGHHAVDRCQKALAASGGSMVLVTMNVDDLHDRAGSEVHHIHGRVDQERCNSCGITRPAVHEMTECACGSFFRSNVVLFGEPLAKGPSEAVHEAIRSDVEVVYVVGSSGATGNCWAWVVDARTRGAITVMVAVDPDPDFAMEFDVIIDDTAENIEHYLPVHA